MKHLSVRFRLWLSLGAMMCLLFLIGGANILQVRQISKKINLVSDSAFPAAASSLSIKLAAHEVMELINTAALASRQDILDDLPKVENKLHSLLPEIQTLEKSGFVDPGQYEQVIEKYNWTKQIGLNWVDATLREDWEKEPLLGRNFNVARRDLETLINGIEQNGTAAFLHSMAAITATTRHVHFQTIAFCLLGAVFFVGFSIVTSRSISRPISSLLHVVQELRKNKDDYSQRVDITSNDEIGRLAREFNGMLDEQEKNHGELKKYTGKLEYLVEKRTQQLQHEKEAHKESEEYLKTIFYSTRAGIIIIDPQTHRIEDANPFALKLIGRSLSEVQGKECHNYICPTEVGNCPITDLGLEIDGSERMLIGSNKQSVNILKTVVPFYRRKKKLLIESFIDITELKGVQKELQMALDQLEERVEKRTARLAETNQRLLIEIEERKTAEIEKKQLQEQLKTAEKMEAIGKLAGSVAHDLNNVLSGVVSFPELILMELPADSPMRESIEVIKSSGEKAAAIVQDLLTLARRNVLNREMIQLNDIIETYLSSPEHDKMISFHQNANISLDLDPKLLPIKGSSIHISKTIMNLVSNGLEAMLTGGRLRISTRNIYLDKPLKNASIDSAGDFILLEIEDEGIGISEDDKGKIFEPFYTKKSMGRSGTGLGMSVVWSTVKDHEGHIDLESQEGRGSVFRLYFPATREAFDTELKKITIDHIKGNGERLLIVDDHKDQRVIASAILDKLNYQTTAVASGEAAVDYLKNHPTDLVILDMIMDPGIDGLETYIRIKAIKPDQNTIIASGFSESKRVKKAQKLGAGEYIKKPYTLEKIGITVKKALKETKTPRRIVI